MLALCSLNMIGGRLAIAIGLVSAHVFTASVSWSRTQSSSLDELPSQRFLLSQSVDLVPMSLSKTNVRETNPNEADSNEATETVSPLIAEMPIRSPEATDIAISPTRADADAVTSSTDSASGNSVQTNLFSRQAADLLIEPPAEGDAESVAQYELREEELREQPFLEEITVPPSNGEVIRAIEVRYIDRDGQPTEGRTRDFIITREFELQAGDTYDPEQAQAGLEQVINLNAIQNASLTLEPTDDLSEVIMIVNVVEASPITFLGGTQFVRPWVLRGITLPRPTATSPLRLTGLQLPGSVQWRNIDGNDQNLTFGLLAGDQAGGAALTFVDPWIGESSTQIGYAATIHWLSYLSPNFNGGEEDVALPNTNEDFWERRVGGGVQVMQQPTPEFGWAGGISYELVSVRNGMFSDRVFSDDEFGNALTLSDDGVDTLLTAHLALVLDQRNDPVFPTNGSRFQFAIDQSIPVGEASIFYTRPMGNVTQFVPLSFIQVGDTPSTLILNLQGGALLGDAPPYEAFALGGSGSVRGYGAGEVASAQTFLQASVEYRVPFASLRWGRGFLQDTLGEEMLFAGNVFFDYATGFGTQTFVTGEPGVVRGKSGDGFGYGIGLLTTSNFGLVRLEFGISDEGDTAVYFAIGDRF
jgi:outer membrane protein insertion porin family